MSDTELLEYISSSRFFSPDTKERILWNFCTFSESKKQQIRIYFAQEKSVMIEFLQSLRLREDISFHELQGELSVYMKQRISRQELEEKQQKQSELEAIEYTLDAF